MNSALASLARAMRSRRTAAVSLLSFSSGLPLGLVWFAIPDWMRDIGSTFVSSGSSRSHRRRGRSGRLVAAHGPFATVLGTSARMNGAHANRARGARLVRWRGLRPEPSGWYWTQRASPLHQVIATTRVLVSAASRRTGRRRSALVLRCARGQRFCASPITLAARLAGARQRCAALCGSATRYANAGANALPVAPGSLRDACGYHHRMLSRPRALNSVVRPCSHKARTSCLKTPLSFLIGMGVRATQRGVR
jgi:hypothetical protein